MGKLQASVPIGVMMGYIIASIITTLSRGATTCGFILCWRIPFLLEVLFITPFCIALYFVPAEHINLKIAHKKSGNSPIKLMSNSKTSIGTNNNAADVADYMGTFRRLFSFTSPSKYSADSSNNISVSYDASLVVEETDTKEEDNADSPDSIRIDNSVITNILAGYNDEDNLSVRSSSPDPVNDQLERSALRRQSITSSLFNAVATKDVIRKSSDDIANLDSADDLLTLITGHLSRIYSHIYFFLFIHSCM